MDRLTLQAWGQESPLGQRRREKQRKRNKAQSAIQSLLGTEKQSHMWYNKKSELVFSSGTKLLKPLEFPECKVSFVC